MRAIQGHFTIQNIQQQIQSGQTVIKLPFSYKESKAEYDVSLGFTSQPWIHDINDQGDCQLLDDLHDSISLEITNWIDQDIHIGSGGVVEEHELEEGQIGFYLEEVRNETI